MQIKFVVSRFTPINTKYRIMFIFLKQNGMVSLKTILDPSYTVIADNNKYHRCIASSNTLEAFNKAIYHNFGI
jgi:hypothetical protein